MKVYSVNASDGEAPTCYATKREAVAEARRLAREVTPPGESCDVEELTLVPLTKATIVRLINVSGGYVDGSRVVATFKSKRKEDA